jgi:2-polyprenyl-3-methyl-5-hydroxy-6-metoxy-1,4-benzoquinol methylase
LKDLVHYTHCPVCGATQLKTLFSVTDYSVSKKEFPLVECDQCTLRFTQDIPSATAIATYYQFEDYISHTNSNKGIVNQLYRQVRKITLLEKKNLIHKTTGLSTGKLLDMGSGTGAFAGYMKKAGWQVTGLEPDEGARKVAYEEFGVVLSDTSSFYELAPAQFDVITLWHVLEHVHELQSYVQQLKKLLKPTGKLIIAVPNYTSVDASYFGPQWAAYDVPRHLYHFSPSSMRALLATHQLKLESIKPMWFDSFYVSMLSSKYKTGKLQLFSSIWTGFISNLNARKDRERCSSLIYIASY